MITKRQNPRSTVHTWLQQLRKEAIVLKADHLEERIVELSEPILSMTAASEAADPNEMRGLLQGSGYEARARRYLERNWPLHHGLNKDRSPLGIDAYEREARDGADAVLKALEAGATLSSGLSSDLSKFCHDTALEVSKGSPKADLYATGTLLREVIGLPGDEYVACLINDSDILENALIALRRLGVNVRPEAFTSIERTDPQAPSEKTPIPKGKGMLFKDCHFMIDPKVKNLLIDEPDMDPYGVGSEPLPQVWARAYNGKNSPHNIEDIMRYHDRAAGWDEDHPPQRVIGRVFSNGSVSFHPAKGSVGFDPGRSDITHLTMQEIYASHGLSAPFTPTTMVAGTASCVIDLEVVSKSDFKEAFGVSFSKVTEKEITDHLIYPFNKDDDIGARLDQVFVTIDPGTKPNIGLILTVTITDPEVFHIRAAAAGRQSGRDHDWNPSHDFEAIFDVFCAANDSPSPVDMGFEIVDWCDGQVRNEPDRGPEP